MKYLLILSIFLAPGECSAEKCHKITQSFSIADGETKIINLTCGRKELLINHDIIQEDGASVIPTATIVGESRPTGVDYNLSSLYPSSDELEEQDIEVIPSEEDSDEVNAPSKGKIIAYCCRF